MSSLSLKFGGFFKQLFQKAEKPDSVRPVVSAAPTASPVAASTPVHAAARTAAAAAQLANKSAGPTVEIPLSSVLAALPQELKSKVCQEDVTGLNFRLPVAAVLPQLASGAVRISFADLRKAMPTVFTAGGESDAVIVALPLQEILSRLNPALLTRRPTQKQILVPEEISSPFADRGSGLTLVVGNSSPQAPGAPVAPQVAAPAPVTPVQRASSPLTTPLPGGTDMFQRKAAASAGNGTGKAPIFPRKPGAPSSNGTEFLQRKAAIPAPAAPVVPHAEIAPAKPIAFKPSGQLPAGPVSPLAPAAPVSTPAVVSDVTSHTATPLPAAPPRPKDLLTAPPVARSITPAKPAAASNGESDVLLFPLSALVEGWSDAVRTEIVQSKLTDARLAVPAATVEDALKRGRVAFAWKLIRSWIRPGPTSPTSPNDAVELELPLAVLAPVFVARRKAGVNQPRVTVSDTIPNLFFGLPKPDAPKDAKPADTNYFSWNDHSVSAPTSDGEVRTKPTNGTGGTDLLVKCAAPNEIVSRAAALDGVAGALIALPDGLMVASRIPAEFNGDTLAAFLPHIFSKVTQCTKELRMGDLNNLNFTVGNVPWKIFRVNAIFFAAFGRVGEGLPTADLSALAAELDRKRS